MGAFAVDVTEGDEDNFNLRPIVPEPLPDDQERISLAVYQTTNILKLLRANGAFANNDAAYHEFVTRIIQAARVGCTDAQVHPPLATAALEQIRTDIFRRKGIRIVYGYLMILAWWAFVGIVVGGVMVLLAKFYEPALAGYGWVIIGSMIGAWISVAVSRREVSFDGIQDYIERRAEPFIRMLFVAVFASIFALFLQLKILSLAIGDVDLGSFAGSLGLALVLGVVLGIGEKALSVQLIDRAQNVIGAR